MSGMGNERNQTRHLKSTADFVWTCPKNKEFQNNCRIDNSKAENGAFGTFENNTLIYIYEEKGN